MEKKQGIGFFERYLTIWVALCIVVGIGIGQYLPIIPDTLSKFEYAKVSIPVAILILVDDLSDDAQSGFPKREERRKKTQRHYSNLCYQLANKAVHDVRHCMALLLRDFQGFDSLRSWHTNILLELYCWVLHPVRQWYLFGVI